MPASILLGGPALVTGATGAIGRAIALMLANKGCRLALNGRDRVKLEEVGAACLASGASAVEAIPADLCETGGAERLVERVRRVLGAPRALVHAAGLFDWAAADEADPDVSERLLAVNLASVMRLTRLALPHLTSHEASALIFVSSMAGQSYFANNAAYVASKHGLTAFARSVFLDMRHRGLKVSAISPGLVAAGASLTLAAAMHPFFLRPDDVAEAVRYVLSASAGACPVEILLEPQRDPWRHMPDR